MSNDQQSQAERVARAMKAKGLDFEAEFAKLSDDEALALKYNWEFWGRPKQLAPTDKEWDMWMLLGGRGSGKTRSLVEFSRSRIESGASRRQVYTGRTLDDIEDYLIHGESGILAISRPDFLPIYKSKQLTWPNGAIAIIRSADKPDSLRGNQCDTAIIDELAAWRYPEALDMLIMGNRLGEDPKYAIATTPRPIAIIKKMIADDFCRVSSETTFANRANLAKKYLERLVRDYEGTRMGRQELYAELLSDNPGALWNRDRDIDRHRVTEHPELVYIVVAVDPADSDSATMKQREIEEMSGGTKESSEIGIVVTGLGTDGHFYVLLDASMHGSPLEWAQEVVTAYNKMHANLIVYEKNYGGRATATTILSVDPRVAIEDVTAKNSKQLRAEPVSSLSQQGRIHFVGAFPELEDQMCDWVPGKRSPDRLDAFVWSVKAIIEKSAPRQVRYNPLEQFGDILPTIG